MSPDADGGEATAAPAAVAGTVKVSAGGAARGVIRWDEILPRRSLRVLLVEHDDSTRQVVTALLRKCGYRVAAVADGMKAWEVMRGRAYAFDLVLTEVNMPTLSGIDLLSRIVAADECRNIPVIMMSSQDSIGTVLKCMQNGAVDFLVKPVRKNELRNLWQHVWRRHSMNSQLNASENNAASNHISVNSGNGSKTGENTDEESDAQSSGSKQVTEIQSADKLPEVVKDNGANSSRELKIQNGSFDRINTKAHTSKGTDDAPSINACATNKPQVFSAEKNVRSKYLHGITSAKVAGQIMDNALKIADASSCRPSDHGKDLLPTSQPTTSKKCKSVTKNSAVNPVVEKALPENLKGAAIGHAQSGPSPSRDINIGKQQRLNGCTNQELKDKDNFNHSNSSAFSRYGNKRIDPAAKPLFPPSLHLTFQEPVHDKNFQPGGALPSSQEHNTYKSAMQAQVPLDSCTEGVAIPCSSNAREDAGTSSSSPRKDTLSHPPYGFIPVPIPVGAAIPYHYGAIMQPIYYPQAPFMQCDPSGINHMAIQHASYHSNYHQNLSKPSDIHEHRQLEENQQLHYSRQILQESGEPIDLSRAHVEHANQSASCSQDIRRGSGWTVSGETDTNTNTIIAPESGNESTIQNFGINGLDSDRSRREAALMKFRMKRKERCFEKKVRYHSRKKLAEQRPRIKGQFVSQKLQSAATTTEDAETD